MNRLEIWNSYWTPKWVAENGLGRLDPYPDTEIDGGLVDGLGLECVRNENGILFLYAFCLVGHAVGLDQQFFDKKIHFGTVIERLVRTPYRGLFNRRPYGDKKVGRHEAHDNYVAIAGASHAFELFYAREICSYADKFGGNFNNVEPLKWEAKQQRQGGELAYYQLCAGYVPNPFWLLWMLLGALVQAWKPTKDPSGTQLSWVRLYTLQKFGVKGWLANLLLEPVIWLWVWGTSRKFPTLLSVFEQYYKPYHPIREMAVGVKNFGF